MSPIDAEQVGHIARMAILATLARAVATCEFESSPEIHAVKITVHRFEGSEVPVEVDYLDASGSVLGAIAL